MLCDYSVEVLNITMLLIALDSVKAKGRLIKEAWACLSWLRIEKVSHCF